MGIGPAVKHKGLSKVPEPMSKTTASSQQGEAETGRFLVLAASQPDQGETISKIRQTAPEEHLKLSLWTPYPYTHRHISTYFCVYIHVYM